VVDLMTATDNRPRPRIEAGVDLIHAGVFAQFPLGEDLGVSAAVRRSYLDRILALVLDEESAKIAPRFFDWQARLDGKNGGAFALGYTDQIDAPTDDEDETVTITIGTQRLHGLWERDIGEQSAILVQPFLAVEWSDVSYEDEQIRESTIAGLRAELKTAGRSLGIQGGLDMEFGDYSLDLDDDIEESGGERSVDTAWRSIEPYVHSRVGRQEGLRAEVGARVDNIKIEDQYWRVGFSPRARGIAPVNERLTFVGDLGVYHQPTAMDITSVLPAGPSLELERSWGPGLGVRLGRDAITLQVDAYYRRLDHLAMFEADGSLVQGEGVSYGLENMLRWSRGSFSGWTAYTWSRSRRQEDDTAPWQPHEFEQPHYMVHVVSWRLPRRWNLSGRLRAGSGYPWQAAQFDTFDLLTQQEEQLDPSIHLRLQPYHSMDLKVSRDFVFKAWKLDAYLDVQNLYNRRVPEPVITGVDDSDAWYSYGLPTLLIFGVKGVFWP